jgi:teichuronic acid biosynthesis glycosyltransferase TuaG
MPAYKADDTIDESVQSVLSQTYINWELIIIDDGNETPLKYGHEKITVIRNEQNMGVAYCRNRGIKLAKGEYIAFLDADDLWRKDKLKKQIVFIQENNADISYTASAYIGSSYVLPVVEKFTVKELQKRNLMSCSSVICKRDLLLEYPFTYRKHVHEDYSTWIRIVKKVGVAYGLDEPLLIYRMSDNSKSAKRTSSALMTYNAYREVGYNVSVAFGLTVRYAVWSIKKRKLIYDS